MDVFGTILRYFLQSLFFTAFLFQNASHNQSPITPFLTRREALLAVRISYVQTAMLEQNLDL
jgi:hypothetical protein